MCGPADPRQQPARRRVVTVVAVLAGLAVCGVGGTVVDAAAPARRREPPVHRWSDTTTTTVCSITEGRPVAQ